MSEAVELLTLWERGVILTFNTCRLGFVNFCSSFFIFLLKHFEELIDLNFTVERNGVPDVK